MLPHRTIEWFGEVFSSLKVFFFISLIFASFHIVFSPVGLLIFPIISWWFMILMVCNEVLGSRKMYAWYFYTSGILINPKHALPTCSCVKYCNRINCRCLILILFHRSSPVIFAKCDRNFQLWYHTIYWFRRLKNEHWSDVRVNYFGFAIHRLGFQ